ncbi:hypothetical protein [Limimaricola cinnabarinus]|jgi:hypothetical protein|uniref:Uncharacterized protein n=1 Tax=Limimaricola cinnabarinus TaxID=1125964 RepID=A0A2G1MJE5_9RHOB|nr:hypothetical protein [Limimaricola cinnabarinus]PHP28879.1 hypothetical protein CJ301_04050 [Limimaricola cinnabarinus]
MMRLVLLLLIAAALVFAGGQALKALRGLARRRAAPPVPQEDAMPAPFRTIAYIVLLALMAGTATGLLGAG